MEEVRGDDRKELNKEVEEGKKEEKWRQQSGRCRKEDTAERRKGLEKRLGGTRVATVKMDG